ncbi:MAG: DUF2304 family protein [Actinobacteria bacterium]|nr:DUF2304 family protein [Actinomycetota bacterium]
MSMVARQALILGVFGLAFSGSILLLAKQGKLSFRFVVGWLGMGVLAFLGAVLVWTVIPLSDALGITPATFGLFVAVLIPLALGVELTVSESKHHRRIRDLAESVALLTDRLGSAGVTNVPVPARDALVVVPALNEGESVGGVVRSILAAGLECLVVDDGSRDETATVARAAGAHVISMPFNTGIGGALRAGFRWAVANGYRRVVQCDADGQHSPDLIRVLLAEQSRTGAHLVIGSRELLIEFSKNYPQEYMESFEALIVAAKAGYTVVEVPTEMSHRIAGIASNRPLKAAGFTARVLVGGPLGIRFSIPQFQAAQFQGGRESAT